MNRRLVILESAAGPLYVVIMLASLWILLRGHNEPGGGFIGGLVAVSATVLWAVAHGTEAANARLPWQSPVLVAAAGVGIGALSGIPAMLVGDAFLTAIWGPTLPLGITELKLSTVLLFDIGVYLAVWGGIGGYALALLATDSESAEDSP
jgi:multicomponent Na+:H+ antiporter subunit B